MFSITSSLGKRLAALAGVGMLISLMLLGLINPMQANAAVAIGGRDIGDAQSPRCSELGLDIDGGQASVLNVFTPSDFSIEFISRNELLVKATDPEKRVFSSGDVLTIGEVVGEGCLVSDPDSDDTVQFASPGDSMFSVDVFRVSSGDSIVDQYRAVNDHLGVVDTDLIESVELTWAFSYNGGSAHYVLTTNDDGDEQWASILSTLVDNVTGLIITNFDNIENINRSLVVQEDNGVYRLVSTESDDHRVIFRHGLITNPDRTESIIFAKNTVNLDEDYIAFAGGNTIDDLVNSTGFIAMHHYNRPSDSPKDILVLGGAAAVANSPAISGGGSLASEPSCESEGGSFSFLICPLLEFADGAIALLDAKIFSALVVEQSSYNDPGIISAWSRIRNIGYVILIPIMLVMVIGTALGFSAIDAYTVKRALPRLFAAVIFMALSYDISRIMIETTNGVGQGVAGLISQPFGGLENMQLTNIFSPGLGSDTSLVLVGTALWLGGFIGIGIMASYMFVGAIVLLIVFIILALRRVILVGLILLAPLAIISWIFPGNDKLWKLWWSSFTKLLMLFPLIIVLLTTGRIFATLVDASDDGLFGTLIKLTAFIGPYFFIPSVFKYAGGAFGNLAGMVNDKSKGVFDRQKKYRSGKIAENRQKSENFSRFSDKSKLGRGLNTIAGASRAKNFRAVTRGKTGIDEARAAGRVNQGAENLKNDRTFQANQHDDKFLLALANEDLAKDKIKDATTERDAAVGAGDTEKAEKKNKEIAARTSALGAARNVSTRKTSATRTAALEALAKTGYQFSYGEEGYDELAATVKSITGGDPGQTASLMNGSQFHLKNAGRTDLGGINDGARYDAKSGADKVGLYQIAGGKPESIKAIGADVIPAVGQPMTEEAAVWHQELQAMKPNATGANRDVIVKQIEELEAAGVRSYLETPSGGTKNVSVRFDSTLAQTDAVYAAQFTTDEKRAGGRTETVAMTNTDAVASKSRQYERPDPNNL
jgi:hypothetical protein